MFKHPETKPVSVGSCVNIWKVLSLNLQGAAFFGTKNFPSREMEKF